MHGWQQGMFGPETRKRQKLRLSGKKNWTLFVSCAPFEHCCVKWTLKTCGWTQDGMHIILVNCHGLFEHTENLPLKWSYPSPILDPSMLVSKSSGTPFLRMSCCSPHSDRKGRKQKEAWSKNLVFLRKFRSKSFPRMLVLFILRYKMLVRKRSNIFFIKKKKKE